MCFYVYYGKDQILKRLKQEDIAKEREMSWLVDFFRRKEHEQCRSEIEEKEECATLDPSNSHAVIDTVMISNYTYVSFTFGLNCYL
jgi:hypothetical protein